MPKRIQRKRTKGWRLPENARCVTRPSRWGNPFHIDAYMMEAGRDIAQADPEQHVVKPNNWLRYARILCVSDFRKYAEDRAAKEPEWLAPLRGKDLACYCQPGEPCHADVLLDLANRPEVER